MLNFLINHKILDYSDVYIYTSTLHQQAYTFLKKYYSDLENAIKTRFRINAKIAHFYDADDEIKNPSDLDPNINHVMVFDDVTIAPFGGMGDFCIRDRARDIAAH